MVKKEGVLGKVTAIVVSAILAYLVYFFLNASYDGFMVSKLVIALISFFLFAYVWLAKGFFKFFIFTLTAIPVFISLEVSFNLGLWLVALISFAVGGAVSFFYNGNDDRYSLLLLVAFIVVWTILAFNVTYREDWLLENYLTIPFVIIIFVVHKWFKLSKSSYSLIYLYMFLHIVGSHYTYSEVPFGFWLQNFFDLNRNHYDRIVHFSFGALLGYPIREMFIRIANTKGFWSLYTPVELVLGFSAIYELIEWGISVVFGGDLGIAYLGAQGDIWDAQQDMFMAGLGSIIAMLIVFLIILAYRKRDYLRELAESFRVKKQVLGERALQRWD
ncbi:MAG: DUF2238 domain-containing protein [archaeon]